MSIRYVVHLIITTLTFLTLVAGLRAWTHLTCQP